MGNLTVQKVVLALITTLFFVVSPWLTSETLKGNTFPLIALAGVAAVLLFVCGLGNRCWLIIPFCLPIEGNLNFLPLNFSIQELAIFTVFCYLILKMILGLDVHWRLGPALLWVPLSGLLVVILYHWIISGDVGIRLLGGSGWGGRKYFQVILAALSLPLLASFPGVRWTDLQKIPLLYFLGSFVDIVPDVLSTFIPSTAPLIWKFYSGVNISEFGSTLMGNFAPEQGITRFRTFARLGTALGLVTICYFPANSWLNPSRLWAPFVTILGALFCSLSGFRNTIFGYGLSLLAGLFATLRFRVFIIFPVLACFILLVGLTQGRIFNYPIQIQRALSFLPGAWDSRAIRETEASNKWRERIKTLFWTEYFSKNPILGVGYHYDPELARRDTDVYLAVASRQAEAGDEYADVRRFIEQRMPHEGPVHIVLVTGLVGAGFFIMFCAGLLIFAFRSIAKTPPQEIVPIQIWATAILLPQVLGFFIVFGELTYFLMQTCVVVSLLYRFVQLKDATPVFVPAGTSHQPPPSYQDSPWQHGKSLES